MYNEAPQPPPPPDPTQVAQAQMGTNIGTAAASNIIANPNVVGPTGSTTYSNAGMETVTGPGGQTYQIPRYTQTTTLSPEQQQLYNQQTQFGQQANQIGLNQLGSISNTLGSPMDASGLPQAYGSDDLLGARSRVEGALFDRLNPQLDRDRDALETRLVNQGFLRGSDAFKNEMDQ